MLARIAKELFWLGRYLARAEHTARMLDGIFHVNLQARAEDQPGLPPGVGPALRYLRAALEHRFRYDVEVDEVVTIQAGEFDIEVEG